MSNLMRRGRFEGELLTSPAEFMSGIDIGSWVFEHNLDIDRAHLVMLVEQDIVDQSAACDIFEALDEIEREGFESLEKSVDTHVTTEQAVIERTGEEIGGRLHTARSRNDKFATWVRMAVRDNLLQLCETILNLRSALLEQVAETADWLVSAYTSLQRAQPTTMGHHLLAFENVFQRHYERLIDAYDRVNQNPLGSAAVAGSGFDIDRQRTTELLGFDQVVRNSMDAVATRDTAVEAVSATANLMVSLSRFCEELVRWSSHEFDFIELNESFTGTSSIMPQKKNPYSAEIARSNAATVIGNLQSIQSLLKGLPMAYNHDFQEATRQTLQTFESAHDSLKIISQAVETATFNKEQMERTLEDGFVCATELADTIVRETDHSFRTSHHIVATLSAKSNEITPDTVRQAATEITDTELTIDDTVIEQALDPQQNVIKRDSLGGPGEIHNALEEANTGHKEDTKQYQQEQASLERARRDLVEAKQAICRQY